MNIGYVKARFPVPEERAGRSAKIILSGEGLLGNLVGAIISLIPFLMATWLISDIFWFASNFSTSGSPWPNIGFALFFVVLGIIKILGVGFLLSPEDSSP